MKHNDPIFVFRPEFLIKLDTEKMNFYALFPGDETVVNKKFDHIPDVSTLPIAGVLKLAEEFAFELECENPYPTKTP